MASGSFSKTVGNRKGMSNEYISVWWSATPDVANNRSKVRAYAKMYRPWYLYVDYTQHIELYINGTKFTGTRYGWRGQGWTEAYIDKTAWVPHNSDGTKSIYIRLRTEVKAWLRSYVGWVDTGNQLCKLDKLARKSSFTISPTTAKIGDTITVKLSRSSTAVRHAISLKVGDKTFSILAKGSDNGSTTSYSYTLSAANILPAMVGQTATATVTLTTYNGNTSLGTNSQSFTINLRDTDKPTLTDANVSLTPIPIAPNTATNCYIQGKSGVKITVSPTTVAGASGAIKTYRVAVNDTAIGYTSNIINYPVLKLGGPNTIKVSVIDGRGMISDVITKTINVQRYIQPLISQFTASRCLQDGTLNKAGTYVKITFSYKFAGCSGNNSATITLSQKNTVDSNTYSTKKTWTKTAEHGTVSEVFGTYPVDDSFDFKLNIKDTFNGTGASEAEIGTEELLVDLSPSAVAVGKVVERDSAFEVAWNAYFEGTIYGTVQANTSDERLKTVVYDDIEPLLRIWDNLTVVLFKYNQQNDDKIQMGLIAQKVIELFEDEDLDWRKYGIVYEDPETGYYSINYEFINQLSMVKSKIMQLQLLRLESRIDALEANR